MGKDNDFKSDCLNNYDEHMRDIHAPLNKLESTSKVCNDVRLARTASEGPSLFRGTCNVTSDVNALKLGGSEPDRPLFANCHKRHMHIVIHGQNHNIIIIIKICSRPI